jgi:hypothetical protein
MKPRVMSLLGALLLTGLVALPVLAAAPPGKVTIQSDGCTFTVHIDLDHAYDLIGWKVKEYDAANWNEGLTLFKGSGPTDGSGDLTVGPFTAPEGRYNVAVDDEYPPDGSSIVVDFFLSCPTGSEAPIGSEAPVGSEQPIGSELPIEGSAPPSGGELGITGTPRPVTPPPTDAGAQGGKADAGGWQVALMVILALSVAAFGLMPERVMAAAKTTVRRRER